MWLSAAAVPALADSDPSEPSVTIRPNLAVLEDAYPAPVPIGIAPTLAAESATDPANSTLEAIAKARFPRSVQVPRSAVTEDGVLGATRKLRVSFPKEEGGLLQINTRGLTFMVRNARPEGGAGVALNPE